MKYSLIFTSVIILFVLFVAVHSSQNNDIEDIKNSLKSMVREDQQIRTSIDFNNPDPSHLAQMEVSSKRHIAALKEILQKHPWITISQFGKEADHQAWLLVQHADYDIEFQKMILGRLEKLYTQHETSAKNYGYLYDRVAMNEHRPQRYGTQGNIVNGQWVLYSVECPETLDVRRLEIGLPPMDDYIQKINEVYQLKSEKNS